MDGRRSKAGDCLSRDGSRRLCRLTRKFPTPHVVSMPARRDYATPLSQTSPIGSGYLDSLPGVSHHAPPAPAIRTGLHQLGRLRAQGSPICLSRELVQAGMEPDVRVGKR